MPTRENVYFDQPKYEVFPAEPNNDPHQMWQIIAYGPEDEVPGITIEGHDRISRLKEKANPQRGMDATFLIPSYSFGNNDSGINDWTLTAGSNVTAGQSATRQGGMWRALNSSSGNNSFSLSTIIKHLPRGHYRLEFQYISTSDDVTYRVGDRVPEILPANSAGVAGVTAGGDNVQEAGDWFKADTDNGRVIFEFDKITDESTTRALVFQRENASNTASSFYLDNIRLTYFGDNVAETVIDLTFPNEWNTVILPFDAPAPAGLEISEAMGLSFKGTTEIETGPLDYHIITLSSPVETIKANYPYVVRNLAHVRQKMSKAGSEETVYRFTGYPTNRKNDYQDAAGVLTGLTEPRGLEEDSQVFPLTEPDADGVQFFNQHDGETAYAHPGRSAYLNGRTAPGLEASRVYFSMDNIPTGIENVANDNLGDDTPVNVYNTQGIAVKRGVGFGTAMDGLPGGIYLIETPYGIIKACK